MNRYNMGSCRKYRAVTNVSLLQYVCGEYEEEEYEEEEMENQILLLKTNAMHYQKMNQNCPHCRFSATGTNDIYQQKVSLDKETHECHELGMKVGSNLLFAGSLEGNKDMNSLLTKEQLVVPFRGCSWRTSTICKLP